MITQISRLVLISGISLGFVLKTIPANAASTVSCESDNGRYQFCKVNTNGGVRLTSQLSSSSCREGSSWGYQQDGIWVDNGCRAEFEVKGKKSNSGGNDTAAIVGGVLALGVVAAILGSDDDNDDDKSSTQSLTCASEDNDYTECRTNDRPRQVVLKRQLSSSGCWEGDTWGYEKKQKLIWVDGGCRAEFEIQS